MFLTHHFRQTKEHEYSYPRKRLFLFCSNRLTSVLRNSYKRAKIFLEM